MEEVLERTVGRLAPSPTGALHIGNVRTFMVAWLSARARGGRVILRIEDLDHPRDKAGAAQSAIDDLRWLGFDWDEVHVQSSRTDIYREALEYLQSRGLAYPCVCSRRDVINAQSAPHAGEQLYYPGTCRGRFNSWEAARAFKAEALKRQDPHQTLTTAQSEPCWRFCVQSDAEIVFHDGFCGDFRQDVASELGDFPLARNEYGAGYTLAVVVDDLTMGVTEVIRGDDLLAATPAQILLARSLLPWARTRLGGAEVPRYCHIPLVVGKDGKRLAKRHGDTRVASLRAEGWTSDRIMAYLARSCGWTVNGEKCALRDILNVFNLSTIPKRPFMV